MATMKLEGEVIISSALAVGTFAGFPITMPIGRYFPNTVGSGGASRTLYNEFKFQLDTATGRTWTVIVDDTTDAATGKVTITASGAPTTGTWTSTVFRDLLGFDTNLASANTWTGANHAKYLFLPNCGRSGVMAPEASQGAIEADFTMSIATDGTPYGIAYSRRYLDSLEIRTLKGSKTWISKAITVNEGLEQFYGDVIFYGLRVRFHADRANDTTFRTWVVEDAGSFKPTALREDWTDSTESLWGIRWTVRMTT